MKMSKCSIIAGHVPRGPTLPLSAAPCARNVIPDTTRRKLEPPPQRNALLVPTAASWAQLYASHVLYKARVSAAPGALTQPLAATQGARNVIPGTTRRKLEPPPKRNALLVPTPPSWAQPHAPHVPHRARVSALYVQRAASLPWLRQEEPSQPTCPNTMCTHSSQAAQRSPFLKI